MLPFLLFSISISKSGRWDTFKLTWLCSPLPLVSGSSVSFCLYYPYFAWFWLNSQRFLCVRLWTRRELCSVNFRSSREPYHDTDQSLQKPLWTSPVGNFRILTFVGQTPSCFLLQRCQCYTNVVAVDVSLSLFSLIN